MRALQAYTLLLVYQLVTARSTCGATASHAVTSDDLVFGMGSAATLFCERRQLYIAPWWRGNLTGRVFLDAITPDVANCSSDGNPRLAQLQVKASSCPASLQAWAKVGERIIWSQVAELFAEFPDKKWYILSDDDTMFMLDNLLALLRREDPEKLLYMGGLSEEGRIYSHWSRHGRPLEIADTPYSGFAFGGAGIVVSGALMRAIAPRFEACLLDLRETFGGDERLGHCVRLQGVPASIHPGFHQLDWINPTNYFETHPRAPVISIHHLEQPTVDAPLEAMGYNLQRLAAAMHADPPSFLQQTVCVFGRMGSFSISNGFSVRWWDNVVNATELLTYIPYRNHAPKDRYIFAEVAAAPEFNAATRSAASLAYTYSRVVLMPASPLANLREVKWDALRVIVPVLPGARWDGGAAPLCCTSAFESADSRAAEVVLHDCVAD